MATTFTATNDDGEQVDVTLAVQVLYDLYTAILVGSGFTDADEDAAIDALEAVAGWPVDGLKGRRPAYLGSATGLTPPHTAP